MKKLFSSLLVLAFALLTGACTQIDTGHAGIESTMGQYKTEVLNPGVYFTLFKTVTEVNAGQIHIALDNLTPKSTEQITMADFDVDIYYQINAAKAPSLLTKFPGDLTKGDKADLVGNNYFVRNARNAVFAGASQYKAAEMNSKREEIEGKIMTVLQAQLDRDVGKDWYRVDNVNIKSIVADKALEASIQASAKTQFEIGRKTQEIELARQEAARKEAEANGIAKSNRIIADSLTPQLIRLKEIEAQQAFAGTGTHTVLIPQGGAGASVLIGK